ncbi:LppP/LprE family lipoprotein [Nocardia tengchongensis]|uniref:LppP/LprE family lipoprotein n=1 Tax=Nocardia tengchongensis TaxID=2055889 RepID=UPI003686E08A
MKTRSAALLAMAAAVVAVTTGCNPGTSTGPAPTTASPVATSAGSPATSNAGSPATTSPGAAPQQQGGAPAGSGHGLCFDINSELAHAAIAKLNPPPVGGWQAGEAGDVVLASGCDGVLSWMTVNSNTNHPYTHVLFFTGGTYLGTATSDPYMYTQVSGKTRNSLSLTYRWLNGSDPMCCPQGGPSVVTFTLDGTKVTANGQFPPHA